MEHLCDPASDRSSISRLAFSLAAQICFILGIPTSCGCNQTTPKLAIRRMLKLHLDGEYNRTLPPLL